jgi:hypothetical protein
MADIVIIRYEDDPGDVSVFSVNLLAEAWRSRGHRVTVHAGTKDLPPADVAFLHVNLSVVPADYAEAAQRYRRVINGKALDIRKRVVSRNLISSADEWGGPVILKTDFNFRGLPEWRAQQRARIKGKDVVTPPRPVNGYRIFPNFNAIPEKLLATPGIVLERFLPEREGDDYVIRTWLFLGERERCRRFWGSDPLVKAHSIKGMAASEVPDFIRSERARLGVDYGKFDFVMHAGEPILLDANKTPGNPPDSPGRAELYEHLAGGLDAFLAG